MRSKRCQVLAAAALSSVLAAAPSFAAVTFFSLGATTGAAPGDPGVAASETTVVTFDASSASFVTETDSGAAHSSLLYSGSILDVAAAPAGDTTKYEALGKGDAATFTFGVKTSQVKTISVYVGSVDSFNTIYILGRNGVVENTINGNQLPADDGDQGASKTNRRLYISQLPRDFSGIKFASSGIAFEYDDIAISAVSYNAQQGAVFNSLRSVPLTQISEPDTLQSTVPEPSAWAIMIAGLSITGWMSRRRRRVAI